MNTDIHTYDDTQTGSAKAICELLAREIHSAFPNAESKVWHGHPVWFLAGNPIVGYAVRKDNVQPLFWSGQSFDEPGLKPEGTFKAAEFRISDVAEINPKDLARCLGKAKSIQWDYKNIVKRRGVLERLK